MKLVLISIVVGLPVAALAFLASCAELDSRIERER